MVLLGSNGSCQISGCSRGSYFKFCGVLLGAAGVFLVVKDGDSSSFVPFLTSCKLHLYLFIKFDFKFDRYLIIFFKLLTALVLSTNICNVTTMFTKSAHNCAKCFKSHCKIMWYIDIKQKHTSIQKPKKLNFLLKLIDFCHNGNSAVSSMLFITKVTR